MCSKSVNACCAFMHGDLLGKKSEGRILLEIIAVFHSYSLQFFKIFSNVISQ